MHPNRLFEVQAMFLLGFLCGAIVAVIAIGVVLRAGTTERPRDAFWDIGTTAN
jgi:hypothetical protein